ncbi:S46 family peptidase [Paracrocinitomix mangrovi]|uniref:S46 family peptidase n=1 Tax=Paracrocinitomix mangrovi TaxID=2862509 RepID=UPI001C8D004B|nr:S46 family peptidase [Paracrocinitomix mangrovi]UKN01704.1 S46 family peptidase [Paracrocinitomix mangrovi]
MRKIFSLLILFISFNFSAIAVEGMWIPSLIDMFHSDMKTYGLKLTPEQIYSTNNSSLKDAIIQFNGGCTGEIVSDQGLILTNHHCGLDAIQKHSSPENDLLTNGFWAKDQSQELACPWLKVTFVKEIREVTKEVMQGVSDKMSDAEVMKQIKTNIEALEKAYSTKGNEVAKIKPFSQGNQYFMLVTEDYNDVRLVGAPPMCIGKFGGDTDNWVWPRHTGDFSMFRIYAGSSNESVKYSESNKPYKPNHTLPISLKPKKEGDFTMVYGFPGSTDQHLTSAQLEFYQNLERPARINMRQHSLDAMKPAMQADDKIRIQYTSKQARIANAWKKWIGQIGGLKELNAIEKKKEFEEKYMAKAGEKTEWKDKYYDVVGEINKLQNEYGKYEFATSMFIEYFYVGPEMFQHVMNYENLVFNYDKLAEEGKAEAEIERVLNSSKSFHKNYNKGVDRQIFHELTELYIRYVDNDLLPLGFADGWQEMEEEIYAESPLLDEAQEADILNNFGKKWIKKLQKDPALKLAMSIKESFDNKVRSSYRTFMIKREKLLSLYVEGMLSMWPDKNWWPDANSTMRIAYGKIDGSAPYDGMEYIHYTTIDGIIQKYYTGNPDFELNERFIDLHKKKDYGNYAQDGELWVCFTASNHTTGGNSGSPVIDAEGNLIGINFDRSWESTMSDFMFDESRCRNIVVDIRYVLWVIDKYGEAPHLVEEMNLIK